LADGGLDVAAVERELAGAERRGHMVGDSCRALTNCGRATRGPTRGW
jgi:hypothetical protein